MKKITLYAICISLVGIGFVVGYTRTPQTEKQVIADIEWAAMEACNMKIANVKKHCK